MHDLIHLAGLVAGLTMAVLFAGYLIAILAATCLPNGRRS